MSEPAVTREVVAAGVMTVESTAYAIRSNTLPIFQGSVQDGHVGISDTAKGGIVCSPVLLLFH